MTFNKCELAANNVNYEKLTRIFGRFVFFVRWIDCYGHRRFIIAD